MSISVVPEWMAELDEEDVAFIRRFLLASGSLKEVAGEYGVSYPTVRLRLDRLIQKIRLGEDRAADPYVALIKRLAVSDVNVIATPHPFHLLGSFQFLGHALGIFHLLHDGV